jgi:hypothetical protein
MSKRPTGARRFVIDVGSLYNAEALEKSVEEMQIEASRRGWPHQYEFARLILTLGDGAGTPALRSMATCSAASPDRTHLVHV